MSSLGAPLADDGSRGVTQAGSDLEYTTGTNPIRPTIESELSIGNSPGLRRRLPPK